ncbi:MAG: hypothetical protein RIC35_05300 [Marinoscillum sp.]
MILEEDYIDSMSSRMGVTLAILMCLINVFCFKFVYGALPKWYDGITKLIQLIQVFALITLMIVLFNAYNYKVDFTLMIIVILLSGDAIEVYHGVVKNLFSRRERASLFKVNWDFLKGQ